MVAAKCAAAAVGQVVAVDRGDDDVLERPAWRPPAPRSRARAHRAARAAPSRTLQKAQARVQVSPMIIMVAWRSAQHSPMLGQPASSHTVTRPCSRRMRARLAVLRRGRRHPHPDPVRLAQHRRVGLVRLLGMPRRALSRMVTIRSFGWNGTHCPFNSKVAGPASKIKRGTLLVYRHAPCLPDEWAGGATGTRVPLSATAEPVARLQETRPGLLESLLRGSLGLTARGLPCGTRVAAICVLGHPLASRSAPGSPGASRSHLEPPKAASDPTPLLTLRR